jgi:hypothetical protein
MSDFRRLIEYIRDTDRMIPWDIGYETPDYLFLEGLDPDVYELAKNGESFDGGGSMFWMDKRTGDINYDTYAPPGLDDGAIEVRLNPVDQDG